MRVCGFFQPIILFPLPECLTVSHVLYMLVLPFFKVQLKWGLNGYYRSLFWMHIALWTSPMPLIFYLVIAPHIPWNPVGCLTYGLCRLDTCWRNKCLLALSHLFTRFPAATLWDCWLKVGLMPLFPQWSIPCCGTHYGTRQFSSQPQSH